MRRSTLQGMTSEPEEVLARRLWSFAPGLVGPDESIKGFRVEAADGRAGTVSWATYAPGESYVVVTLRQGLHRVHHVVPAAAVEAVQRERKTVLLRMRRFDVQSAPLLEEPEGPLDDTMLRAFDRGLADAGRLGGGGF